MPTFFNHRDIIHSRTIEFLIRGRYTDHVTQELWSTERESDRQQGRDVRIIAALINPEGHDYGLESVTLLNRTPDSIDLDGWAIVDKNKKGFGTKFMNLQICASAVPRHP